jgi:hypothetical protein
MNLAELKATIEAEALRRQAARDGFTLEGVESFLGKGIVAPPELQDVPPEPPPMPVPFAWFAALNGQDLVTAAYTVILGRSPDAAGMSHFMATLARGEDKAMVIGSLVFSPEGRQRGARVPGLLPRFAVAAATRVPVLGTMLAWGVAFLTLHSQRRHQRAFEHFVRLRLDALARYVGQSGSQVALRLEGLRRVLESRD